MYAPKFRSWLTDWERFDEALSYNLDLMEADALAEIHAMAEAGRERLRPSLREATDIIMNAANSPFHPSYALAIAAQQAGWSMAYTQGMSANDFLGASMNSLANSQARF